MPLSAGQKAILLQCKHQRGLCKCKHREMYG